MKKPISIILVILSISLLSLLVWSNWILFEKALAAFIKIVDQNTSVIISCMAGVILFIISETITKRYKKKHTVDHMNKEINIKPIKYKSHIQDNFGLYREEIFTDMLQREKSRTKRNKEPFSLIMIDIHHLVRSKARRNIRKLTVALDECCREIDVRGWYKHNSIIGIISPEIKRNSVNHIRNKVQIALGKALPVSFIEELTLSYISYPENDTNDIDKGNRALS